MLGVASGEKETNMLHPAMSQLRIRLLMQSLHPRG